MREKKLRSIEERRKVFERLIYPKFGAREIGDIRRKEIVGLLDKIEDDNGPRMAHMVLAYLSKLFNWHAGRDDDFRSPTAAAWAGSRHRSAPASVSFPMTN